MLALIVSIAAAVGIDWAAGDPPNKFHPVAWMGRFIGWAIPRLKSGNERLKGILFAGAVVAILGIAAHLLASLSLQLAGAVAFVVVSTILAKITIAIRGMEKHARGIMECVRAGDIQGARQNLSLIVRRPTAELSEQHVLSATIECIGESTVDGIASPIFYFSLLGPGGAIAYRAINTLDSMVGYKDSYFGEIGWMSAKLDTIANYLPARLTAILMIFSARILGADWKGSLTVLQRDRANTASPNAGYPMATMAGALRVRLEKIGHYSLGDGQEPASVEKCETALSIMKLTTLLYCIIFSIPTIAVLYFAGWWRLLFGIS